MEKIGHRPFGEMHSKRQGCFLPILKIFHPQNFSIMKKNFYPQLILHRSVHWLAAFVFCFALCLPATSDAQEPEFGAPEPNHFGLNSGNYAGAIVKLTDLDHDGTLEAIVFLKNNTSQYVWYYKNEGSNEDPAFVFEISAPFGIPVVGDNRPFQFVDIDGDSDEDLFFAAVVHYPNPIHMKENTESDTGPDFSSPFQLNPYGISLPVSDEDGSLLDGAVPAFADIDNDGDFDLFLGGAFDNGPTNLPDEALFFLENKDPSVDGTDPQFDTIVKNPFGFVLPAGTVYHWEIFADMDCDGDLDMYLASPNSGVFYYENFGTSELPDFSGGGPPAPLGYFNPPAGSFLDIGGDGDLDLISGTQSSGVQFFENITIVAEFDYESNDLGVTFTDKSEGDPTEWLWDFGDGETSTEQHPSHTYDDEGTYEICLMVTNESACPTTFCEEVPVTITSTREDARVFAISLAPNPVQDVLQLTLRSEIALGNASLQIFDPLGKQVFAGDLGTVGNELSETLDVSQLPTGIYLLKIDLGENSLVRKFVRTAR
jgi:PKD domain/Secretion system C-terminal sorting domain